MNYQNNYIMTLELEIFINYTILIYSLFLLLPIIEYSIECIGKSLIYMIKNFVKIILIINTTILSYLWLILLGTIFYESFDFYCENNYNIELDNIKNITLNVYNKILWKKNL